MYPNDRSLSTRPRQPKAGQPRQARRVIRSIDLSTQSNPYSRVTDPFKLPTLTIRYPLELPIPYNYARSSITYPVWLLPGPTVDGIFRIAVPSLVHGNSSFYIFFFCAQKLLLALLG